MADTVVQRGVAVAITGAVVGTMWHVAGVTLPSRVTVAEPTTEARSTPTTLHPLLPYSPTWAPAHSVMFTNVVTQIVMQKNVFFQVFFFTYITTDNTHVIDNTLHLLYFINIINKQI